MSDDKKYYYLKLKENFFEREEILVIEAMPNGYKYSNILLKMYLKSLKREGKLMVTDYIPYNLQSLSAVLGHDQDTLKAAIELFQSFMLIEVLDNGQIYINDIQNFVGLSTTEADRKRIYRRKIDEEKVRLIGTNDGQMSDKNPPELEIELKPELEIDLELNIIHGDTTDNERNILNYLKNVTGYAFDYKKDLSFIRELSIDYPKIDLLEKVKEWNAWLSNHPLTKKSNPRLQIRKWTKPKDWNKGASKSGANKQSSGEVQTENKYAAANQVSSLTDIVKKYPELKEVYEEEILNSEHLIRMLDSSRSECFSCKKEGTALQECRYQIFDYDQVRLSIRACMCDKQKYHYRLKKINNLLGSSRVGNRFKNRTFETFKVNNKNKNAYQKCKDYADRFPHDNGQGLILIGDYGTGKTHLAVAILHELLHKDVAALFVTVPELLEEIRKSFNGDKGNIKSDLLHSIKTAEFLILDDLGAERPSPWVTEQLFMIINARYEDMLPTVITSNLSINEDGSGPLEDQIGARTLSRIIEMCNGVFLDGDDYRKNKLK